MFTKKEETFTVTFVFKYPIPPLVLTGVNKLTTTTTDGVLTAYNVGFKDVETAQKQFPSYMDIGSIAYILRVLE